MFKNPFSFSGRIRRTEYGLSMIIYFIASGVISLGIQMPGFGWVVAFLYIPLLWFLWAQGAKRCHDRDNSGFYQLIPFYGLWMFFAEGDAGRNSFGQDPKGGPDFEFESEEFYA